MNITDILDKARALLSGEPARAIGYGAAAIIYFAANAAGAIPDVSAETALVSATAGIATLVGVIESIRRFVYSKPTVDSLVEDALIFGVDDRDLT